MDPRPYGVIPLAEISAEDEQLVGGKAARLARLRQSGYRVPDGFVLPTTAYVQFLAYHRLDEVIRMELERKPLERMRWEEIWDTALRIRNAFSVARIPADLADEIAIGMQRLGADRTLVVRSSAPGEDSENISFAGLHESVVGVQGPEALHAAVRVVWSSLWSDAALLYRRELGLDPARSRMAVLVQELVARDRSGVAFARDPRRPDREVMVVEAVPGLCQDLVDGAVDPDRWLLHRADGEVVEVRLGERGEGGVPGPLLAAGDLQVLHGTLAALENQLGWPPDVEWTGRREDLALLQARPITAARPAPSADAADRRPWYLSLRPRDGQLQKLRRRVSEELIPQLAAEGERLAAVDVADLDDGSLASALTERAGSLARWKKIYWREFIPFAHGVRRLAVYYNDAVGPEDPYEFVGLLEEGTRLATRCNQELDLLAEELRSNSALADALAHFLDRALADAAGPAAGLAPSLAEIPGADRFLERFEKLLATDLDITFAGVRMAENHLSFLTTIVALARKPARSRREVPGARASLPAELAERLYVAVGPKRREQAREILATARLSWRLRDDDNLLIGRIESQLVRALAEAATRLQATGRLATNIRLHIEHAALVAQALSTPQAGTLELPAATEESHGQHTVEPGLRARQLLGQPGSPGVASGRARCIRGPEDLARFRVDEILVCDAIQPSLAHLVPLAGAVVERRGGMLIHGVIIARELGIPCVNGISGLMDLVADGDLLTVDGHLGIVTVGPPELDLELGLHLPVAEPA